MSDRLVLDERHHRGDRDAVVGAESGAVGRQPVAVTEQRDPALGRIVRARGVTLAHHVQVALEDEVGRRLPTRGRRNADDKVAPRVLLELVPVATRPRADVLDHGLLGPRGTGNSSQRPEMRPERLWLQPGENILDRCHLADHVKPRRVGSNFLELGSGLVLELGELIAIPT